MKTKTPEQIALAWRVMDHITAHPEKHDQNVWIEQVSDQLDDPEDQTCGTAACFAGWATLLSGDKPLFEGYRVAGAVISTATKRERRVANRAKELLGLTDTQADCLFYGGNTRAELEELVIDYFGPRPERVS